MSAMETISRTRETTNRTPIWLMVGGAPLGSPVLLDVHTKPATDSIGRVTWMAPNAGGTLYRTTDEGRTWVSAPVTGLPSGITAITMTGPGSATALRRVRVCRLRNRLLVEGLSGGDVGLGSDLAPAPVAGLVRAAGDFSSTTD